MSTHELAIHGGSRAVGNEVSSPSHPIITPEMEERVLKQLHEDVSIYDNRGIYAEVESALRDLFDLEYVVTTNSGTTAIYQMLYGAGVRPGDEVLVPAYTFFATAAPLIALGAVPILVDSDEHGNVSAESIRERITAETKAVLITHLWGIPCNLDRIIEVLEDHQALLLEDSSHAHGATWDGRPIGSFSDGSAWSLQGKKLLTSGEGGFYATSHKEHYDRSLLIGHFNKRARAEITNDVSARFATTGTGLNFRMHPLGAALLLDQIPRFTEQLEDRRRTADYVRSRVLRIPGLEMPTIHPKAEPSWYAIPIYWDKRSFPGLSKQRFVEAVRAEGAVEVDIPNSTRPISDYPLFMRPSHAVHTQQQMDGLARNANARFPKALDYQNKLIKMPSFYGEDHMRVTKSYMDAVEKVATRWRMLLDDSR